VIQSRAGLPAGARRRRLSPRARGPRRPVRRRGAGSARCGIGACGRFAALQQL